MFFKHKLLRFYYSGYYCCVSKPSCMVCSTPSSLPFPQCDFPFLPFPAPNLCIQDLSFLLKHPLQVPKGTFRQLHTSSAAVQPSVNSAQQHHTLSCCIWDLFLNVLPPGTSDRGWNDKGRESSLVKWANQNQCSAN